MANVITPTATLSFPNLFKAVPNKLDATKPHQFSCMITIPKTADMAALVADVNRVAAEKWGQNIPTSCRHPIKDGDRLAVEKQDDWYAGKWVINLTANADYPPQVVGLDRNPVVDKSQIYAGCQVVVAVNFFAYDTPMNKGVSAGLTAVMKVGDGERLDNRADATKLFAAVAGAPAPLAGQPVGGFGAPQQAAPQPQVQQAQPANAFGTPAAAGQPQPISFG